VDRVPATSLSEQIQAARAEQAHRIGEQGQEADPYFFGSPTVEACSRSRAKLLRPCAYR
jgi:hypothetical protein